MVSDLREVLLALAETGDRLTLWNSRQPLDLDGIGIALLRRRVSKLVVAGSLVRTLRGGRFRLRTPMLYAMACTGHLAILGPATLLQSVPSLAPFLETASFTDGRLHYLSIGCVTFALLGGLHHVWPSVTGRPYHETHARIAFGGLVVGCAVAFSSRLAAGVRGAPRMLELRAASGAYLGLVCAAGVAVVIASLLGAVAVLVAPLFRVAPAPPVTEPPPSPMA